MKELDFAEYPKKEICKHIHGYHGSSKDTCLCCGSSESENMFCEKRFEELCKRAEIQSELLNSLRKVYLTLDKLDSKQDFGVIFQLLLPGVQYAYRNKFGFEF